MNYSGLSTSLVLIATGAVLAFAVHLRTTGIDLNTIGVILMVVGIIGLLFSMIPFEGLGLYHRRGRTYYSDDVDVIEPPATRIDTVEHIHHV
jgi:hypothetical protein